MEFIDLIDQAIKVIHKKETDEHLAIFRDRYARMLEYLEKLRNAYNDKIDNKNICLSIVRMIDHGDDDELQNAIAAVNRYYQKYLYEEQNDEEA